MNWPYLAVSFVAFGLLHIQAAPVTEPAAPAAEIQLRPGGSAPLESSDQTIAFERVESDSRCPKGVACVWEGDAVVRLSIGKGTENRTRFTLHTRNDGPRQAEHAGFAIKLLDVQPYPTVDKEIDPTAYRVTLSITRLKQ